MSDDSHEQKLQANVAEAERKYLDGEELNEFDQRVLAYTLYRGGCHACGG